MFRRHHRNLLTLLAILLLIAIVSYLAQASSFAQETTPAASSDTALISQLNQQTDGSVRISYHSETGQVRFIGGSPDQTLAQGPRLAANSPELVARGFLANYGQLFGLQDAGRNLAVMANRTLDDGRSFVRFQQQHEGVPIVGGELVVQVDARGAVISVNGEVLPDLKVGTMPRINAEVAEQTALAKVAKDYIVSVSDLQATEPELWIYNPALLGGPGLRRDALVWRMEVISVDNAPINVFVLVDAQLGAVALDFNQIHAAKNRVIYDNNNNPALGLPGAGPVRSEGQGPTGTADVDLAYDYSGDTYDFFMNEHGRDSLDGAGLTLTSTVRYCEPTSPCPLANAFWDGSQMAYGAGYASGDDVVGHELTHGVTDFSSQLFYYYQSGAINESFSDVWGEFIDLTNSAGTDTPGVRWLMGEDVPGGAIRDMANPTAFGDPDKMTASQYVCGQSTLAGPGDNGGVHSNSGVNNKAVYLMTDGGSFNGQTVTALGISKVADLYYEVQTNMLVSGSDYADLNDALIQAGINLGYSAADKQEVQDALTAVEMNQDPPLCPAIEAPICNSGTPTNLFFDDIESGGGNWTKGSNQGTAYWFVPQTSETLGLPGPYATSGVGNIWGFNQGSPIGGASDTYLAMNSSVSLPAGAYMHFNHAYGFESSTPGGTFTYDGGIVEYSTNGGSTWQDAGSLFTHNGYNGTIDSSSNPLDGTTAFVKDSAGYISSRLNLGTLSGQNVRFRFRIGTDSDVFDYGWFIDDVRIYTCGATGTTNYVYTPIILKTAPPPPPQPGGPTAGFWEYVFGEFYVTPDRAFVDDFALRINVSGCGKYTITHLTAEPIANDQFSWTGPFYASGTFDSPATASGTTGLNSFPITGCGLVSGGPTNWDADWKDGTQPTILEAEVVVPDLVVRPVADNGKATLLAQPKP